MAIIDPRLAVIVGAGGAIVGSHRVRSIIGRGAGYAAKGVMTVAGPVVEPMIHAGEDIVEEARRTASANGEQAASKPAVGEGAPKARSRAKAGA